MVTSVNYQVSRPRRGADECVLLCEAVVSTVAAQWEVGPTVARLLPRRTALRGVAWGPEP